MIISAVPYGRLRNPCIGRSTTCTRRGARVFNSSRHKVHASGHASREELKILLTLTRPRYFIPVHGEYRHLALHAALARSVGMPADRVLPIDNGTVIAAEHGVRATGERVRTDASTSTA